LNTHLESDQIAFDELRDLTAKGGKPDPEAFARLRAKYDTVQLATLTPG
jgi:hypothetical protein